MNKTKLIIEYRRAKVELDEFEMSDDLYWTKGFIISREEKRRSGSGVKTYTCYYLRKVIYIEGIRYTHDKYIRKGNLEYYTKRLAKKEENKKKLRQLRKRVKYLLGKLKKLKGFNYEQFMEMEEFRGMPKANKVEVNVSTVLGEKVRSKGECIVANMAYTLDIPYYYEKGLCVNGDKYYYPDFTFLINEREVYVELLGMYDLKVYREKWEEKRKAYQTAGIKEGENLVCLVCDNDRNIDSQKISEVLLNLSNGIIPPKEVWI